MRASRFACVLLFANLALEICGSSALAKESKAPKVDSYLNIGEKGLKLFKSVVPKIMPKKNVVKKETNAVFIDAIKIDSDYYLGLAKGITLEIFFLKKSASKEDEDSLITRLMDYMPELRESSYKAVVGYHVYQLLAKDTFTDQIAMQQSKGLVCFIVLCDDKIVHSQSLSWEGFKNGAIHIQFVGRDMYVQYGS
jgi:hypothetical protein